MIGWLRRLFGRAPRYVDLPRAERSPTATIRRDRYAPGTVVWGPVQYADGTAVKDRPAIVVGRDAPGVLLVLALSSQAKRDGRRGWFALGSGEWDRARRPSYARLDPYYRMPEKAVRRVGGAVDDRTLAGLTGALTAHHRQPPPRR